MGRVTRPHPWLGKKHMKETTFLPSWVWLFIYFRFFSFSFFYRSCCCCCCLPSPLIAFDCCCFFPFFLVMAFSLLFFYSRMVSLEFDVRMVAIEQFPSFVSSYFVDGVVVVWFPIDPHGYLFRTLFHSSTGCVCVAVCVCVCVCFVSPQICDEAAGVSDGGFRAKARCRHSWRANPSVAVLHRANVNRSQWLHNSHPADFPYSPSSSVCIDEKGST